MMENSVLSLSCLGFWNLGWLPCSEHSFSTKDLSVALGNQHSSSSRAKTPGGLFCEDKEGRVRVRQGYPNSRLTRKS
jgi:hypothetical protein